MSLLRFAQGNGHVPAADNTVTSRFAIIIVSTALPYGHFYEQRAFSAITGLLSCLVYYFRAGLGQLVAAISPLLSLISRDSVIAPLFTFRWHIGWSATFHPLTPATPGDIQ